MKRNVLKTLEFITFGIIVCLVVVVLYRVLSWKDTNGDYMSTTKQLYSTEDNLMDAVFMGSSHCFCGIAPAVLWEDAGIAAFDMSTSGQDMTSTYYLLKELLKTQRPKVVYVDMYGFTFEKHGVESNEYRNYLSMDTSVNSVSAVKEYFDGEEERSLRQDYYFRFPIVHTRYKELTKYDFIQYEPSVYGRGAVYSWNVQPIEFISGGDGVTESNELSDFNKDMIDRLIELSEEYGFTLEFIVIPFDRAAPYQMDINACIDYATSKGIRCTDFNLLRDEIGLEVSDDYLDSLHLNANGARKLTKYIEYNLLSDYDLEDHRDDETYEYWDMDLEYYYHCYSESKITQAGDLQQFISAMKNCSQMTTIISLEGNYLNDADFYPYLKELGMTQEEYVAGGKWVYTDGVLTKVLDNRPGAIIAYDITDDQTMIIAFSGDMNIGNIVYQQKPYGNSTNELSVFVYDKVLDKIVLSRGF